MEKKKKLTLTISSKKPYNVPHYTQSRQKTSVVIEKKTPRKWGEKKFQPQTSNLNKPKFSHDTFSKKFPISAIEGPKKVDAAVPIKTCKTNKCQKSLEIIANK